MNASRASQLLGRSWEQAQHIAALPDDCRPASRTEGYAVQAGWAAALGREVAGWKIAATSVAGQKHIGVSGPLAGPVFAHRVHADGATVSLAGNRMRVAECEVVFRLGRALAPRASAYRREEVLAAVASVHPGLEAPDSRFLEFEKAGEAQLVADCACTNDMVLGAAVPADERLQGLPGLQVRARVSDGRELEGKGANVLGDPVEALVWIVNELTAEGRTLQAGHFVTTGACVAPIPVAPGNAVSADFGWLGTIAARFT
jgi:2-keto-4-pentenoate hydratase